MRKYIGGFFIFIAILFYLGCGLLSLLIEFLIIIDDFGFIGAIIGFFLLPFTLAISPFYAWIVHEVNTPLWLTYGGLVVCLVLESADYIIGGHGLQKTIDNFTNS